MSNNRTEKLQAINQELHELYYEPWINKLEEADYYTLHHIKNECQNFLQRDATARLEEQLQPLQDILDNMRNPLDENGGKIIDEMSGIILGIREKSSKLKENKG